MLDYCMKIAVCDDETQERYSITAMTREVLSQERIDCELTCFESGMALLESIRGGAQYHVLLLDVMMEGLNGLELAATLRAQQDHTAIVFISVNREMALAGYEVEAERFLSKPVEKEKLREALLFCYRTQMNGEEIALTTARGTRKVMVSQIVYAETWGRGVRVTLADGQEEIGLKISELKEMLPDEQFVLCHRSYLVNLSYVQYLRYCELELKTGDVLPISKYRQNATREKLMRYLEA